jgi:FAD/FMN-containing dehydrogenase
VHTSLPASSTTLDLAALAALAARVSALAVPGDPQYPALCAPWNVSVPTEPLAVVDAADATDVVAAVDFAATAGIPIAVQATGHGAADNLAGALLVRTARMNGIEIHADARWARVEAGVRWQAVLDAAAPYGLAALAGSSPTVGVVGYTTGGGMGPLARTLGVAADLVRAFDVVTGDGVLRRVTATEHPDLFWGLRGGKGALGIVTAIEFDLLPIHEIYAGALYFAGEDAPAVLREWAAWCPGLPPEATTSVVLLQLPAMPGVPEPLAGRATVAVRFAWTGDAAAGEAVLAPMRDVAPRLIDAVGPLPYGALAMIHADPVDPLPSMEHHGLLRDLPPEAVDTVLQLAGPGAGSPQLLVEIRQMGGAIAAGDPDRHAFGSPDAGFTFLAIGIGAPPVGDAVAAHAAALFDAMAPWLTGTALPNFAAGSSASRYARVYPAPVLERLRELSRKYDPAGILLAGRGLGG